MKEHRYFKDLVSNARSAEDIEIRLIKGTEATGQLNWIIWKQY